MARQPAVCGTASGYQKHRRRGEETCQACRDAVAEGRRAKRIASGQTLQPRNPEGLSTLTIAIRCPSCGGNVVEENKRSTRSELVALVRCVRRRCGYSFVIRLVIVPAHADELGDPTKCGTEAGAQQHYRRGEQPCDACRIAHVDRQRNRKAAA